MCGAGNQRGHLSRTRVSEGAKGAILVKHPHRWYLVVEVIGVILTAAIVGAILGYLLAHGGQ